MKALARWLRPARPRQGNVKQLEARFLRLYSLWHETHDLGMQKRLLIRLNIVMRRVPNFDLRSRFKHAF